MSFFGELRRRNVFRVSAGYVVVGWLIIQVVSAISSPLNLPEWFETVVVVLLAIGFPMALLFAWAFDLTPDGIRLTQHDNSAVPDSGRKLDYALVGALVILAAVTFWGQLPSASVDNRTQPPEAEGMPSIAVLPFADMSPGGDQEYFGDGMAEELLNELVRLDGLRVASRTSSFSFKGSDSDVRAIAETLGVSNILEGSIRKDGERVRITAQLINVADDTHIWSDIYDSELADIFAIQEEIATAVAGNLGVALGVGGVNAFRGAGTRNVDAYEAYLEGMAAVGEDGSAISYFERATRLDENYAGAWAQLGLRTAGTQWDADPEEASEIRELAYGFVRTAVDLDPESAQSNSMLGTMLYARHDWIGSEEAHAKALLLLDDRSNLTQYGNMLMRAGRTEAARAQLDAAQAVEPMGGRPTFRRPNVSVAQGNFAEARELAELLPESLAMSIGLDIALNEGNPEEIKAALSAIVPAAISATALYFPVLTDFDSPEMVLSTLRAVYADESAKWPSKLHDIALLAAYFDDPAFAMQAIGEEVRDVTVRMQVLWYPIMSEARQLPEFKTLVTDLNLVAYWRTYGWADACRPLGDVDFTCN